MKKLTCSLALAALAIGFSVTQLAAADVKEYQVTGPVQEVTPAYIIVKKGNENWQIAIEKNTKAPNVKVGDKVTIHYVMTATVIEAKPAKAANN